MRKSCNVWCSNSTKIYFRAYSYEIDEEVRALLNEARNKAAEIIQSNRETHKLIAEALLKYETLDSTQIKSLYETGKMPESVEENHVPII